MKSNLRFKIDPSKNDKIIEYISWTLLIFLWALTAWGYSKLPDQIAIHWNLEGEADSFKNKRSIFYSPIISTIVLICVSVLIRMPHLLYYKVSITNDNVENEYKTAIKKMNQLMLIIVIVCTIIALRILRTELKIF